VLVVIDSKSIDEKSSLATNRIDETGTVDSGFPERSSVKQTAPANDDGTNLLTSVEVFADDEFLAVRSRLLPCCRASFSILRTDFNHPWTLLFSLSFWMFVLSQLVSPVIGSMPPPLGIDDLSEISITDPGYSTLISDDGSIVHANISLWDQSAMMKRDWGNVRYMRQFRKSIIS
jgi:hypothetical protein